MTDPIGPIRRAAPSRRMADRRGDERRMAERRAAEAVRAGLPVPVGPVVDHEPPPPAPPAGPGAFSAHLLGQGGEKRGLRGGEPVLQGARSAYLEAEFSGRRDRRARKGQVTREDI